MTKKQIAGVIVDLDDEGYMTHHAQWNREVAAALAREEGIELTAAHWKVLDFIDKRLQGKDVLQLCSRAKGRGR